MRVRGQDGLELEEQRLDLVQAFFPQILPSFGLSSKSNKPQQRIRAGHGEVEVVMKNLWTLIGLGSSEEYPSLGVTETVRPGPHGPLPCPQGHDGEAHRDKVVWRHTGLSRSGRDRGGRRVLVAPSEGIATAFLTDLTTVLPVRTALSGVSHSPGARHLRACPMREVVTVAWDPHPHAPVEGVLRAASVLELRTLERRRKWWLRQQR
ncbi:hypothetical protein Taro_009146 [Colocasia esculenta]|uniref:Uncharacterized protein n=1 Tax=Colocasia esculenta TaxID=4460 RepID=A0A843U955_COLES|nr:hypothetical protein [Colocasia esculenta]